MGWGLIAAVAVTTVLSAGVFSCSSQKQKDRQCSASPRYIPPLAEGHVMPPAEGRESDDIYGDSGRPQEVDILSGKEIDHEIFADYGKRRVYFHCPICRDEFQLRSSAYLDAVAKRHIILDNLALPAAERINTLLRGDSGMPQTVDVISGKQINPMMYGDYNGKRVYFCCQVSKGLFEEQKQLYLHAIKKRGIMLQNTSREND